MTRISQSNKHLVGFSAAALAFVALAVGCGGTSGGSAEAGAGGKLTLVAYSTPREVYDDLTKDFAKTTAGKGVSFDQSYGSSGEQSRAVEQGLPADVVAFSLAPDMTRLVDAGIVDASWDKQPHKGMVTDSVVVFAVRKGNAKGIKTWDDLVADGVEVVTPNPFTSGGARWNVMAAYGAQRKLGKTHEQAVAYV
ncbi:MAG: extracellular solute-binding protein, partial [Gaiellaceae bacterium]